MTGTYISIALVVDCGWAYLEGKVSLLLGNSNFSKLKNKISGGLFISAALGLALV